MRFVSHIRSFGVQIVEPRVRYSNYGDRIVDRDGYVAMFTQDDVNDADVAFAEKTFLNEHGSVPGRTTALDEVTPTPMRNRVSVYDTDEEALRHNWDEDFKTMVEEFMSRRAVDHPDMVQIHLEPISPPWPRYLDFSGSLEKLLAKIEEDGYSFEHALAYERQSGHRPKVIEALEAKIAERDAELAGAQEVPS